MTFIEWFIFFLVIQVIHFAGTWKLYQRANREAWEAAIPIYNAVILMKIINRPKWWVILLFIPVINQLMFPILWIETARSFGFNKRKDTALVLLTFGFYLFFINYATNSTYKLNRSLKPRTALGEWISSIAFAIIAATLVHTYVMQPYTIPTSSLEKTLLVGDYLFVSKFHYGARVPTTTIATPMLHDSIPTSIVSKKNTKSYLNKPLLPYLRIPGFQKIKRNDIVVFNWPVDTLVHWMDPSKGTDFKPLDKKTNYVKRCVGIAGDTLEVRDGYVYINGKQNILPDRAKLQFYNKVYSENGLSTQKLLRYTDKEFERKFIINFTSQNQFEKVMRYATNNPEKIKDNQFIITTSDEGIPQWIINGYRLDIKEISTKIRKANITDEIAAKLRKDSEVDSVVKVINPKGNKGNNMFPQVTNLSWNTDNYGPIYIPKKGTTVPLNMNSIPFYERIIDDYENNQLEVIGEHIFVNGKKSTSYTFKQDYYWMMGDNRQNSLDARSWGYVPFDHVVGKPVLIWFSINEGKIRWERLFTTVGGNGKPVSYLIYFLIAVAGYIGYSFLRKNKKKVS
ncbi:signal peptidase I [Flavobacteriaceae bacterium]|nr:signal peptidase I [Flavobacteriaceae bacterium]MDB2685513.1 signal peptidase I [Flavobacteriaceae bacterium]MDB4256239.1 signal peptidase I [Flavobacteriaceae bacterium]